MKSGQLNPAQLMMSYLSTEQGKISDKISTREFARELEAQSNLGSGGSFAPTASEGGFAQGKESLFSEAIPSQAAGNRQLFTAQPDADAGKGLGEKKLKALQQLSTQKKPLKLTGDQVREDLAFGNSLAVDKVLAQLRVPAEVRQNLNRSEDKQGRISLKSLLSALEQTTVPQENIAGQAMVPAQDVQELVASLIQLEPGANAQLQPLKLKSAGAYSMSELQSTLEGVVREITVQKLKVKHQTAGARATHATRDPGAASSDKELSGASPVSPNHVEKLTTNLMPSISGLWDDSERQQERNGRPNQQAIEAKIEPDVQEGHQPSIRQGTKISEQAAKKLFTVDGALPQPHQEAEAPLHHEFVVQDLSLESDPGELVTGIPRDGSPEKAQSEEAPVYETSRATSSKGHITQQSEQGAAPKVNTVDAPAISKDGGQTGESPGRITGADRLSPWQPAYVQDASIRQPDSGQMAHAAELDTSIIPGNRKDGTEGIWRKEDKNENSDSEPTSAVASPEARARKATPAQMADGSFEENGSQPDRQPAPEPHLKARGEDPVSPAVPGRVQRIQQSEQGAAPKVNTVDAPAISKDGGQPGESPGRITGADRLSPGQPSYVQDATIRQPDSGQMAHAAELDTSIVPGNRKGGSEGIWRKEEKNENSDSEPTPAVASTEARARKATPAQMADGSFRENASQPDRQPAPEPHLRARGRYPVSPAVPGRVQDIQQSEQGAAPKVNTVDAPAISKDGGQTGESHRSITGADRLSPGQPSYVQDASIRQPDSGQMAHAAELDTSIVPGNRKDGTEGIWREEEKSGNSDSEPTPAVASTEARARKATPAQMADGSFEENGSQPDRQPAPEPHLKARGEDPVSPAVPGRVQRIQQSEQGAAPKVNTVDAPAISKNGGQPGESHRSITGADRLSPGQPSYVQDATIRQPYSGQMAHAAELDTSIVPGNRKDGTEGIWREEEKSGNSDSEPTSTVASPEARASKATPAQMADGSFRENASQPDRQPAPEPHLRARGRYPVSPAVPGRVQDIQQSEQGAAPKVNTVDAPAISKNGGQPGESHRSITGADRLSPGQPSYVQDATIRQPDSGQMAHAAELDTSIVPGNRKDGTEGIWREEEKSGNSDSEPTSTVASPEARARKATPAQMADGSFEENGSQPDRQPAPEPHAKADGQQAGKISMEMGEFVGDIHDSLPSGAMGTGHIKHASQASSEPSLALSHPDWPADLGDKLSEMLRHKKSQITLELEPREMGRLLIKIETDNNQVHAWVSADNEQAKALLTQNAPTLKQHLEQQGLMLGQFTVDVRQQKEQPQFARSNRQSARNLRGMAALRSAEADNAAGSASLVYERHSDGQTLSIFA